MVQIECSRRGIADMMTFRAPLEPEKASARDAAHEQRA